MAMAYSKRKMINFSINFYGDEVDREILQRDLTCVKSQLEGGSTNLDIMTALLDCWKERYPVDNDIVSSYLMPS